MQHRFPFDEAPRELRTCATVSDFPVHSYDLGRMATLTADDLA